MADRKPIIGITLGDPAGIGPEIAVKALSRAGIYDMSRPFLIGDAAVAEQAAGIAGVDLPVSAINDPAEAIFRHGTIDVLDLSSSGLTDLEHGKISAESGKAAFEAIKTSISLALDNRADAIVTGPIHKAALNAAGYDFPGHTEIFAHYTGVTDFVMLLIYGSLRVAHVTTHVPLRKVPDLVTKERVLTVIKMAHDACLKIKIEAPRVAVAGLNPHSGDDLLFGWEEEEAIKPAVENARAQGINVEGPIPADVLFAKAIGGHYDICVAMYHDQGHIPLKASGFIWDRRNGNWGSINGVNITLGLPIIRTSVDHGTAFDIAGKGIAKADSMINAIEYAVKMAGLM